MLALKVLWFLGNNAYIFCISARPAARKASWARLQAWSDHTKVVKRKWIHFWFLHAFFCLVLFVRILQFVKSLYKWLPAFLVMITVASGGFFVILGRVFSMTKTYNGIWVFSLCNACNGSCDMSLISYPLSFTIQQWKKLYFHSCIRINTLFIFYSCLNFLLSPSCLHLFLACVMSKTFGWYCY